MKIRNNNTCAEYSSATLEYDEFDDCWVDDSFDDLSFNLDEGWEEVKEPDLGITEVRNGIVINGVYHVLVEDKLIEGDCRDCSLQQLCDELRGDGVCIKMFDKLDSHFEVKEETK